MVEIDNSTCIFVLTRKYRITTQMMSEDRATHSHSIAHSAPTRLTTMVPLRCKTPPH